MKTRTLGRSYPQAPYPTRPIAFDPENDLRFRDDWQLMLEAARRRTSNGWTSWPSASSRWQTSGGCGASRPRKFWP